MRRHIFLLLTLFFVICSFAQEASITVKSPPKVGVGQAFEVQYTINQQGSNLQIKNTSNISVINGPNTSSSTSIQMINGSVSQSVTYTYSYTMKASTTGTLNLPNITISANGKTYSSPTKTIEVQKDPVQQNNRQQGYDPFADFFNGGGGGGGNSNNNSQNLQPKEITNDEIFVRIFLNKNEAYKGEPIVASIKIFSAYDIAGFDEFKVPAFDGFYAQEIETPKQITFSRENYNNKVYYTAVLSKYILYPRNVGTVKIDKCKIDLKVRTIVGSGFFARYEYVPKTIYSGETSVKVNPLPDMPTNFSGAVGNFSIRTEQSADTVNVNDAISFKITINGTGNFNTIEIPKFTFPNEFEVYDPEISNHTNVTNEGLSGFKTWEYTIIPRYPGKFEVKIQNFSYFDLITKQYKTLNINNIKLFVKKTNSNGDSYTFNSQDSIATIGHDIRFIKTKSLNLQQNFLPIIFSNIYWLFLIFPLVVFIVLILVLRKKIKEISDISKMKQKKANKVSQKRLKKAKKFIQENNKNEFYKEVISALWGYAGDKLNINVADLTKTNIRTELENKNIENNIISDFINIIEKCEYAHFAPATLETELNFIFKETSEIIEKLEQKIK